MLRTWSFLTGLAGRREVVWCPRRRGPVPTYSRVNEAGSPGSLASFHVNGMTSSKVGPGYSFGLFCEPNVPRCEEGLQDTAEWPELRMCF